ncbi:hypothetical protein JOH48_008127 [Bradyrhizobium elkanii]|nr:hypothetical protein [Bradyrhizobium elkanii]
MEYNILWFWEGDGSATVAPFLKPLTPTFALDIIRAKGREVSFATLRIPTKSPGCTDVKSLGGFRDDVAHLSDLISPGDEAFWR